MAALSRELRVSKPRADVLASVLADLGPAFQSEGYSVQTHGPDGVTFVRTRSLGRGVAGLLGAEQSIAVSLSDEDGGTRITIVGEGPGRLKRAIGKL